MKDCVALMQDIGDASQAYAANSSTANCIALRNAYQAAVDADCPGSSIYQSQIDELDCN